MSTSLPVNAYTTTGKPRLVLGTVTALALAAVAVLLDPSWAAGRLAAGSARVDAVTTGMWVFKALLLLHAAAIVSATRIHPAGRGARLLTAGGVDSSELRGAAWMLGALLLLAAALRLYGLNEGLWYDEIAALVRYVRSPFADILTTYDSQNQHPLYSLLAHASMTAFGDSAWTLRLPAALFGIASLWATYWLGTLVASRREGLLAAALLTASYHHVWFSQNARGYSGLLFFALVTTGLLVRLLRSDRADGWRPAVLYGAVTALGVYTLTSAVFITAGQFLIWSVLALRAHSRGESLGWPGWLPFIGFALATTLTLQLYAPVLPQVLETATTPTMRGVQTPWKDPVWFAREAFAVLAAGIPGGLVTVGAALVIGVAGVVSYARRSPAVLAMMLLPAGLTAAAMLLTAHNLWPRLFFFCAGFAALLAVRGVMTLATVAVGARGPAVATALLVAGATASLTTVPRAWNPKQDFSGARDFIEANRAAGDAVVMLDLARFPYERYMRTGWTLVESDSALAAIERQHARTWVVYTFPARLSATQPEIWTRLQRNYNRAGRFGGTVNGGAVIVMVRE